MKAQPFHSCAESWRLEICPALRQYETTGQISDGLQGEISYLIRRQLDHMSSTAVDQDTARRALHELKAFQAAVYRAMAAKAKQPEEVEA